MKIDIYVIPNSKVAGYVGIHDGRHKIRILKKAIDNQANNEILKRFSELFNISKSSIKIIAGNRSRMKVVDINIDMSDDELKTNLEKW